MLKIKKYALMIMCGLSCSIANAKEVIVDEIYAKPTYLFEDGTVMQTSEVDQIQIFYSVDKQLTETTTGTPAQIIRSTDGKVNFTIDLEAREKQYNIYVYARVLSIYGGLSKLSNGVKKSYIVSEPPPKVPSNLINLDFNVKCKSNDDCVVKIVK